LLIRLGVKLFVQARCSPREARYLLTRFSVLKQEIRFKR